MLARIWSLIYPDVLRHQNVHTLVFRRVYSQLSLEYGVTDIPQHQNFHTLVFRSVKSQLGLCSPADSKSAKSSG